MGSCRRELARGHPLLGFCLMYALTLEGLCLPEELGGVGDGNRGLRVGVAWGGSPSSPQPSGTAKEADARAAARNTITLPRPGMGLRIWRRQSREGEGVIFCRTDSPEHPSRTVDLSTLSSHPILPGTAQRLYGQNPS